MRFAPWRVHDNWSERRRVQARARSERLRKAAQALFGGGCVTCGFSDWRALKLDHKTPVGSAGRKLRTIHLYRALVAGREDRKKYRLLCANCHDIKTYERDDVLVASRPAMERKRAIAEVLAWKRSRQAGGDVMGES